MIKSCISNPLKPRKASRFLLVINILRAFGSQSVRLYDHGIGQMEGIIKGGYRSRDDCSGGVPDGCKSVRNVIW